MNEEIDEHGFEIFEQNPFPIAYLLTFRTYGSWLHGDERGSYKRVAKGPNRTKVILPSVPLKQQMREIGLPEMKFDHRQRELIMTAIHEVCIYRQYLLRALNVRSNHVHSVHPKAKPP